MALENNPKISVVMSVYKEPLEWLHQSIDSILNQTISDFEFIIICDNPGYKEGIELLEAYKMKDKRIVLVFNEQNIGLTKSLNKGLAIAKGEYIARMDADDISLPDRFDVQLSFMEKNPNVDVCHTNFSFIDKKGIITKYSVVPHKRTNQDLLFCRNIVGHPTVLFKQSLLDLRTPFYNENYRSAQDYELWTYLTLNGIQINFVNSIQLQYRVTNNQVSSQRFQEQHNNTYEIRRSFIFSYLSRLNVWNKEIVEPISIYKAININYNKLPPETQKKLGWVLYVLYYTMSCGKIKYVLNFLLDKRMRKLKLGLDDIIRIIAAPVVGNHYKGMKL